MCLLNFTVKLFALSILNFAMVLEKSLQKIVLETYQRNLTVTQIFDRSKSIICPIIAKLGQSDKLNICETTHFFFQRPLSKKCTMGKLRH